MLKQAYTTSIAGMILFVAILSAVTVMPSLSSPSFAAEYMSPKKQMESGVSSEDITCKENRVLALRDNGKTACVKETTAEKLNWEIIKTEFPDTHTEMTDTDTEMTDPNTTDSATNDMGEVEIGDTASISKTPADAIQDTSSSALTGEITIGSILPLTGDLSSHGIENLEGSKFGVVEFNKHLEEIDAPWSLKMISEDSNTNPVTALDKLTALNAKGIGIVVGPETSSNIKNIKGYSDSNNMLLVSCCSSSPALAIPDDSVFRLVPDDSNQGAALGKLLDESGIKVLVPVWRADTWGDGLKNSTEVSFIERGGQVDEGVRYNPEAPEFSVSTSILSEKVEGYVNEHGADKVAVLYLGFAEILLFMQSASQYEVLDDVRWFGPGANTKEHKLIDDPDGLEFSSSVNFTTVQVASSNNTIYQKVQSHVTEELGRIPSTFVHASYDAVWLIGLAMLEAQSSDVSDVKAKIPEVAENYSGAIGVTTLNEAGDLAQSDYEIWGIRGGEWTLLGKYTQSDDSISFEESEMMMMQDQSG